MACVWSMIVKIYERQAVPYACLKMRFNWTKTCLAFINSFLFVKDKTIDGVSDGSRWIHANFESKTYREREREHTALLFVCLWWKDYPSLTAATAASNSHFWEPFANNRCLLAMNFYVKLNRIRVPVLCCVCDNW